MSESKDATHNLSELAPDQLDMTPETALKTQAKVLSASIDQARMMQTYWVGLNRYIMDFMAPAFSALESFSGAESDKLQEYPPEETIKDYMGLLEFNLRLAEKGLTHGMKAINDFLAHQLEQGSKAWHNTLYQQKGEDIAAFMAKQARLMELVVHEYPQAIRNIEPEYGFHFDDGNYIKTAETERFCLYQVLPWDKSVKVRKKGKPVVIIPPYVLGANILSFLPGEGKSFVHCFANTGTPTYIRIVKDIYANPAVQEMTGEEDCLDTKFFLEKVKAAHHRPVTLCGYCQGGFTAAVNYLSGELDGLVDALITSVAPMDGTRSKSLSDFMAQIPKRFEDISFAMKTLPNGNRVVDGKLMSWVYKLKSMEKDNPIIAFIRDLKLFERNLKINKTAAAINYWLLYDQTDLPLEICKLSFNSYNIPVAKDGTLPVKLFGRPLNFKRAKEKGIKWLICVAEKDDLVEKESALTPTEWVDAEVSIFPKGHVAIATSWSMPATECSLDKCFLNYRGPVRFHMDLEAEADKIQAAAAQKLTRDKARLEADLKAARDKARLEADLKAARDKAKAEPAAALPAPGEKIQGDAPQKAQDEKPRSVTALKAMQGKAEPEAVVMAPADKTHPGQKAEEDKTLPVPAPKQEA